jgi:hypothetical protein
MAAATATLTRVAYGALGAGAGHFAEYSVVIAAGDYAVGGISATAFPKTDILREPDFTTCVANNGYLYHYEPGTSLGAGLFMIRACTNGPAEDDPLGELAAGAIAAGALTGNIKLFGFWFNRFP